MLEGEKVEHLKKRQELQLRLTELNHARELMEAEMEAEKAYVSFSILDSESGASAIDYETPRLIKKKQFDLEALRDVDCKEDVLYHSDIKPKLEEFPRGLKPPLPVTPGREPRLPIVGGNEQPGSSPQGDATLNPLASSPYRGWWGTKHEHEQSPSIQEVQAPVKQSPAEFDAREQIVKTLSQVMNTPKLEYMHFNGDPINYASFIHNFETCLEDSTNNSRNLQLLIQHCTGVAREAIESCVNLPVSEGYKTAKETLKENFGLPHIIAKAHLKKLENLPPLKNCAGSTLLEFARHLEIADRTLRGMGPDYVSVLNHSNTLMELSRKLPFF